MELLGKYRILSELGKGGFATVYRAEDTTLGREVALKVLDPLLMRDTAWVERFRHEARAVAALDHPAIVTVHEIAEAEGRLFIAMKLIRGPSLEMALTERGAFPWEETQRIIQQVATALDYAHGKGILHRDLKPGNILLDPQSGAVLTDFGFARLVGESSMSVSLSGGLVGTPAYIAPELWHNRPAGAQSDLYALGCILYELVTGRKAFTGDTPPAVMMAHFQPFQAPETWPEGTPPGIADVLRRTLAQEPGDRYASTGELLGALDALQVDPLAEPYTALQAALATEKWDAALRLAEDLRAQQPDYRDVATLAQQAQAGWDKAQRIQAAAPWKAQAQAALQAGQPTVAQAALAQWLKLTPEDEAAQRMQAQLAREAADPDLTGFRKPVRSDGAVVDVPAKPPTEQVRLESIPRQKGPEAVQSHSATTRPESPVKSGSIPGWVWAVGLLALIAALVIGSAIGGNLRATPTPEVITVVETVEKMVIVTAAPPPTSAALTDTPPPAASVLTDTPPFDAKLGDTWTRPADRMVMVYVPAGEFQMGSEDGDDNEKPVHTVSLDAFWIDRTEVSVAQFRAFVAATGHKTTAEVQGSGVTHTEKDGWKETEGADWQHPQGPGSTARDEHPVLLVSWDDAIAYCEWAGGQLPTEAQWEYAARGPENRQYPWGDDFDGRRQNYCDAECPFDWKDTRYNDGYALWSPVGSYPTGASWVGALDLAGNVWEWTADWDGTYPAGAQTNPTGPATGEYKMVRGGSWNLLERNVHTTFRGKNTPTDRNDYLGFRCIAVRQD